MPPEDTTKAAESGRSQQQPLTVLWRSEHLLAVCKPAGMPVHRGWSDDPVTAADIVRDQIVHQKVHAVHRLDRATSGVLLFALDADAARFMQNEWQNQRVEKNYVALVRGPMKEPCVLDHPVPDRDGRHRVDAITEFLPMEHQDRWSLVHARPLTGRLHQIRRHLKHLSHPIVGDVRYGKGDINRFFREQFGLHRLALHATAIKFAMPPNGTAVIIEAPLTPDLALPLQRMGFRWPSGES